MQLGVYLVQQHLTWPELAERARVADRLGFESAWLLDHFLPIYGDADGPCMEAWTTLGALAAVTDRIHLGTLVSGVTYRHPSVLATQIATLDHISKGRAEIGLGAGWHGGEHAALGIDFPATPERVERLGEALEVIERLLTTDAADFDGEYYTLDSATYRPRPDRHLPVWIGGTGERLILPLVARYADAWHAFGKLDELPRKSALLDRLAGECGRRPDEIVRSASISFEPDTDEIRRRMDEWRDAGFTYLLAAWPSGGAAKLAEVADAILRAQ